MEPTIHPSNAILEKVFAPDHFKEIDTAALVKKYDFSTHVKATIRSCGIVSPTPIPGNPITSIPPEGYLITQPGTYTFANNIPWSPAATAGATAITIAGDNISLDFCGYSLTGIAQSGGAEQYIGVSLTGASCTITNGAISNMSLYGIYAVAASALTISSINIDTLVYVDTDHPAITPSGIFIGETSGFTIGNCNVSNIDVMTPSCAGIQVVKSTNGTISGCNMSNFFNHDGAVQGYSYLLCSQISTNNCSSSTFQSAYAGKTITTGHTILGFCPIFCMELQFDTCSATDMTGCCDDCHGISVFLDALVTVKNFTATGITDGVCPKNTGAKATGIEVYGYSIGIHDCRVSDIKAIVPQDKQAAGFSAWGCDITFSRCTATNVNVTDASGNPSTDYGYGAGYGWAPDPRQEFAKVPAKNVQYLNCTANSCQLGFDTWNHIDGIWGYPVTTNCGTDILQEPSTATRTFSMDKCSEVPSPYVEMTVIVSNMAIGNKIINS
ncbi:MAG: right-handed parallel beta-helix repeat-containing protein [Sediminibacterium sp.]